MTGPHTPDSTEHAPPPGYRDVSIPVEDIMRIANVAGLFILIGSLLLFLLLYGWNQLVSTPWSLGVSMGLMLMILLILIIAHEAIHALMWVIAGRLSWRNVTFGMKWKSLAPYAHIDAPVSARVYRLGTAMPGIVTGVIPAIIALLAGSGFLMLIGAAMITGAVGDVIVLWVIRGVRADALMLDHPSAVGCYVQEKTE